ncbi:MAG TPA: 3-oxoacyl-ACP reductase FabG [Steroidobacteraceae bacterium]|nr:3-oxoacyl-ACP reductase FabG [Steroidobacteraceae bacterium]
MDSPLKNDIALVTGASRGIGRSIALELARCGATVIGTATSQTGATAISDYLAAAGLKGRGLVLDVGRQESVDAAMADVEGQEGSASILVNNAGITRDTLLLRMKPNDWDELIATNLGGVFRMAKACVRGMMKARRGRIVSISSVVGAVGNAGQANYAAAKAGIEGFSRALAKEVASRGITVNVVAPGFIDTDMTRALDEGQRTTLAGQIPMARLGVPEDIAAAVGFLVSSGAAYITGQTLHVNGGMYMT